MKNKTEETQILVIDKMSLPSLSPDLDQMWQQVKWALVVTRKIPIEPTLKELDSFICVFIEARNEEPYKRKFETATGSFINNHIGAFLHHLDEKQQEEIMKMSARKGAIAILYQSPACRRYINAKFYL